MTIRVKHPKDHPDVQASKEDDYKGKYYKDKKKSARRFADTVQTIMAKKRSETEGSFRKGGRVNTRRENRLEELGRVDSEKAYTRKGKRNLRAEKKRIVREVSSRGAAKRGHGKEIK
jgi:hypothetical protein